eukprot:Tbor_TRINITY_DN9112_c0_g1::TRINITY_DN9112_c0_g1_i1::g.14488::m.14488
MLWRQKLLRCHRITLIEKYLSGNFVPANTVSRSIPEDLLEDICETDGGLVNYMKNRPKNFDVMKTSDGIWKARTRPHVDPTIIQATNTKMVRLVSKTRGDTPPFDVPPVPIPIENFFEQFKNGKTLDLRSLYEFLRDEDLRIAAKSTGPSDSTEFVICSNRTMYNVSSLLVYTEVPEYDVCRLARMLNCDSYSPFFQVARATEGMLTMPIFDIVISRPNRFICENVPISENHGIILAEMLKKASSETTGKGTTISPSETDKIMSSILKLVNKPIGVKYRCSDERLLLKVPATTTATIDELQASIEEVKQLGKDAKLHFMKVKDKRNALLKKIYWKKFPNGTPTVDDDVILHEIYDMMEGMPQVVTNVAIRDVLQEKYGNTIPYFKDSLVANAPHMFTVNEGRGGLLLIARADSSLQLEHKKLTDAEVILELISLIKFDYESAYLNVSNMTLEMPRPLKKIISSSFENVTQIFLARPDVFIPTDHINYFTASKSRIVMLMNSIMDGTDVAWIEELKKKIESRKSLSKQGKPATHQVVRERF